MGSEALRVDAGSFGGGVFNYNNLGTSGDDQLLMDDTQDCGGTIGETTMEVVGMPQFHEGQRSILFVSDDVKAVSPLVGFYHGRMRVEKDAYGVDRVRTYDGRSLANPAAVGANKTNYMLSVTPMRLEDLETAVRGRVSAGRIR